MANHPTVQLPGPSGVVEIDVELAPVITALWALGVATRQCCQYDELSDSAEISFPTASDMTAFVESIFLGGYDETDEMQDRIRDWEVYDPASNTRRLGWRWTVAPEWNGTNWDFAGRVEFPTTDLPAIVERLAANDSLSARRCSPSTPTRSGR